jgi:hypothetical protein
MREQKKYKGTRKTKEMIMKKPETKSGKQEKTKMWNCEKDLEEFVVCSTQKKMNHKKKRKKGCTGRGKTEKKKTENKANKENKRNNKCTHLK